MGSAVIEDFEFAELRGGRMSLTQWRGRPILLVFFDPSAESCQRLVPTLVALSATIADNRPLPVIVSTGDEETNRRVLASKGVECPILLQETWELAAQFLVRVTPLAYLLDEEGRIASPPAIGPAAILALGVGGTATAAAPGPQSGPLTATAPAQTLPAQTGLAVGTPAPAVRVPLLTGGELSLKAYRGRRVLLVFLDPQHGPCLPVAAQLEAIYRRAPTFAIVVISRGSDQMNRDVVAELGLTFPIGLQRHWEVSRAYAMFAAPIAYLIDERGAIAHEVAIGADAVLALARSASPVPGPVTVASKDAHLTLQRGSPNGPV
jgi:peroxiredoxin